MCRDAGRHASLLHGAALLLAIGSSAPASSQDGPRLEVEPAVIVSDNPFLLEGPGRSAGAAEIAIRPSLTWSLPPGGEAELNGAVVARQYSRTYNDVVTGRVHAEARNRESEYLSWTASASGAREQAIDILTSTIDAVVDPRSLRTSVGSRASLDWNPDPYTTISPSFGAIRSVYSGVAALENTRAFDIGIAFNKRTNERTVVGGRATSIFSRAGSLSDLNVQTLSATIDHRLVSNWRLSGDLGLERSGVGTIIANGVATRPDDRLRMNGQVQFCRERPRDRFCFSGALRSEVSGLGGLQRQLLLRGTGRVQTTERDTIEGNVEYRKSTMWEAASGNVDALRVEVAGERRLRRPLFLRPALEYLQRQLLDGRRIGAVYAQASLIYRWEPQ